MPGNSSLAQGTCDMSGYKNARWALGSCLVWAGLMVTPSLHAEEFRVTCRGEKGVYVIVFDSTKNTLTSSNPQFVPPYKLKRTQVDEDGALVWASVAVHYGERDLLVMIGKEKWVRYFYGNGSTVEDTCRN